MTEQKPTGSSKVAKNAIGLFLLQFVTRGLSAIWTFYLARRLGAVVYGLWANIMALTSISGVLQGFGILSIVVKEISQNHEKARNIYGASLITYGYASLISFTLIVSCGWFLGYPTEKLILVCIAGLSFIIFAPGLASQSILYGHEKFIFYTVIHCVGTLIYMCAGFAAVESGLGVRGVLLALCFGYGTISIYLYWKTVRLYSTPIFKGSLKSSLELIRHGLPLVIGVVLSEVILRADRVLIDHYLGEAQVGYYQATFNVIYLPKEVFMVPLITAVYTRLCAFYISDRASFERLFEKVNIGLLMIALPISGVCTLVPETIIQILYGQGYAESAKVLPILVWAIPPLFILTLWQNIFVMQSQTKKILYIYLLGAVFSMTMNILFLKHFGIRISAFTSIISQAIMLLFALYLLKSEKIFRFFFRIPRILYSCLATMFILYWFKPEIMNALRLIILLSVGAPLYIGFLFLFKAITKDEIEWIRRQINVYKKPIKNALDFTQ